MAFLLKTLVLMLISHSAFAATKGRLCADLFVGSKSSDAFTVIIGVDLLGRGQEQHQPYTASVSAAMLYRLGGQYHLKPFTLRQISSANIREKLLDANVKTEQERILVVVNGVLGMNGGLQGRNLRRYFREAARFASEHRQSGEFSGPSLEEMAQVFFRGLLDTGVLLAERRSFEELGLSSLIADGKIDPKMAAATYRIWKDLGAELIHQDLVTVAHTPKRRAGKGEGHGLYSLAFQDRTIESFCFAEARPSFLWHQVLGQLSEEGPQLYRSLTHPAFQTVIRNQAIEYPLVFKQPSYVNAIIMVLAASKLQKDGKLKLQRSRTVVQRGEGSLLGVSP